MGRMTNLSASGPRPNPQGSYHYGRIRVTRTIRQAISASFINGRGRYGINGVSFVSPDTPLKLVEYFNIGGVLCLGSILDNPTFGGMCLETSVMAVDFRSFVEIVFKNNDDTVQSWHLDGYNAFVSRRVHAIVWLKEDEEMEKKFGPWDDSVELLLDTFPE
ncbi:hypothetical protein IFM89_023719 [Coptis chinensis]|uniref:Plastocyanin-like domain-containing protein n=1 Tax=Coptis chinensis TaxID=261450 RepID=A0A835HJG9_9MAGN|nr:hypothetical protein IFM89_023719 [Coptis chinensis]